jgi:hypothetical protein
MFGVATTFHLRSERLGYAPQILVFVDAAWAWRLRLSAGWTILTSGFRVDDSRGPVKVLKAAKAAR